MHVLGRILVFLTYLEHIFELRIHLCWNQVCIQYCSAFFLAFLLNVCDFTQEDKIPMYLFIHSIDHLSFLSPLLSFDS